MNLPAIEKLGMKPLERALKHLGGWPVVEGDAWNESTFDWMNVTSKIRAMGYIPNMFADFSVITDPRNNTENIILVSFAYCIRRSTTQFASRSARRCSVFAVSCSAKAQITTPYRCIIS